MWEDTKATKPSVFPQNDLREILPYEGVSAETAGDPSSVLVDAIFQYRSHPPLGFQQPTVRAPADLAVVMKRDTHLGECCCYAMTVITQQPTEVLHLG